MSDRIGFLRNCRAPLATAAAVAAALAACSTPAHHTPASPPPTTAAIAPPLALGTFGNYPLTWLPASDAGLVNRPALSVKVDNAPPARPQAGLNAADIVTEELVEGGLSRFFATYQSQDSGLVGPVRSARPVDADLLRELGGGLFAFSGAAAGELAPVQAHSTSTLLSDEAGDPGFHRSHDRVPPYNLYVSTPVLYATGARRAPARAAPPALFTYASQPPAGSPAAASVSLTFGIRSSSGWTWDPKAHLYQRTQDGTADVLDDGAPVTANDIVIMSVAIRGTGIFDTAHEEDPLVVVIGSGTCWVMRDGVLLSGTWQRPSYQVPVKLVGSDDQVLALRPGRTWVELLPDAARPKFG